MTSSAKLPLLLDQRWVPDEELISPQRAFWRSSSRSRPRSCGPVRSATLNAPGGGESADGIECCRARISVGASGGLAAAFDHGGGTPSRRHHGPCPIRLRLAGAATFARACARSATMSATARVGDGKGVGERLDTFSALYAAVWSPGRPAAQCARTKASSSLPRREFRHKARPRPVPIPQPTSGGVAWAEAMFAVPLRRAERSRNQPGPAIPQVRHMRERGGGVLRTALMLRPSVERVNRLDHRHLARPPPRYAVCCHKLPQYGPEGPTVPNRSAARRRQQLLQVSPCTLKNVRMMIACPRRWDRTDRPRGRWAAADDCGRR